MAGAGVRANNLQNSRWSTEVIRPPSLTAFADALSQQGLSMFADIQADEYSRYRVEGAARRLK